jgi:hypothetical protein
MREKKISKKTYQGEEDRNGAPQHFGTESFFQQGIVRRGTSKTKTMIPVDNRMQPRRSN